MKIERFVLSIFTKENDVIRLSMDKKLVYGFLILVALPYFFLSYLLLNTNETKKNTVSKTITKTIPTVVKTEIIANNIPKNEVTLVQDVKVVESSVEKNDRFKFENKKIAWNGDAINVEFNFLKIKPDNKLSQGHLSIVAMGKDGKILSESEKSFYKFSFSRNSKFKISGIKKELVQNLRIKINEGEHITFLNIE